MKKVLAGLVALVVAVSGFGVDSTAKAAGIPEENIGAYAEGDAETEEIVKPGHSTAEGEELKAQYEAWKNDIIERARARGTSPKEFGTYIGRYFSGIYCTSVISEVTPGINEYTEEDVLKIYKTGKGTTVDKYHVLMDIYKDAGFTEMFIVHCSRFGNYEDSYVMLAVWNQKINSAGEKSYFAVKYKSGWTEGFSASATLRPEE